MSVKKFSFLFAWTILSMNLWGFFVGDDWPPKEIEFMDVIQDIIYGRNFENSKKYVSLDAYAVLGTKFELLYDVVSGKNKNISLTEGEDRKIGFYKVNINDEKNAACIMLKTTSQAKDQEHFHTIFLIKDSAKKSWKILSWHRSE